MDTKEIDTEIRNKADTERAKAARDYLEPMKTCLSCGVYCKGRFGEKYKYELRFIQIFCSDTEHHRQIYQELWFDALLGKQEVFAHQAHPGRPLGIHEDNGTMGVLILQYESENGVLEDIKAAAEYIETRIQTLEGGTAV